MLQKRKKTYHIEYTSQALKELKNIDITDSKRVKDKIKFFSIQTNPLFFSEKLTGFKNRYRWRIGNHRVIFCKNEKTKELTILLITAIKKRSEAYRK